MTAEVRDFQAEHALLATELSLAALTATAVIGLGRLFDGTRYLLPVLLMGALGHLLAAVLRRRGAPSAATLVLGSLAFGLLVTWTQLPETSLLGLPTPDTVRQAADELRVAWSTFGVTVAPAPALPGFVLACSAAIWFTAFAADTASLRAGAPVEAVVPGSALFIFGAALGAGNGRPLTAALLFLALLACWGTQRWLSQTTGRTWLSTGTGRGGGAVLRLAAIVAGVGVLMATVVGPNLPGADAKAVVPWRKSDRSGPTSRVVVSPLVDIKTRLVQQADVEVFRVTSTQRSYWRLTSLEAFDGRVWSSNREYRSAEGRLDEGLDVAPDTVRSEQRFTIGALSSLWLPAAFRPVSVRGTDARFDEESASLLAEADTSDGLTYNIVSSIPRLDPARLGAAAAVAPGDLISTYTALPADFSPRVRQEARRVVGRSGNVYEIARRLQDHFRSSAFTYDLEVEPGHGNRSLERFLFETKAGYCEQFAGAFAAMARSLGLPARVAVGFTPGENLGGNNYLVRGLNGHAWPEVYFDAIGWVPFEPTPGRGIPGASEYTGAPEEQASADDPATATTVPPTTTTVAPPQGETPTTIDEFGRSTPLVQRDDDSPLTIALQVIAVLVLVPVAWMALLAALRRTRRSRRRRSATTPADQVLVAWREAADALARLGLNRRPAETAAEYARRVVKARPDLDLALLGTLADASAAAEFGRGVGQPLAEESATAAATIEHGIDRTLPARARLLGMLDPRTLLPERAPRVEVLERE